VEKLRLLGAGLRQSLRIMARNKAGFAGLIIFLLVVIVAYTAPHFVTLDTTAHVEAIYEGPSIQHPLGTDYQGRDILTQILHGGREVISVAFLAALLTVVVATTLGALSALVGGAVDSLVVGGANLVLTIPQVPLLLVLAGFIHLESPTALALILAAVSWGALTLAIRAQVLSLKERDYVQAAQLLGLPLSHILFKEIIPNMMSYILIHFVLSMTHAVYSQVGLIFLGIVPMSAHNWGVMLTLAWNQGAIFSADSMWYLMTPIAMIVILQVSLVFMTRSLDELFNPRLRVGE
jgi:peptide/nickel transport system permease protein